MSLKSTKLYFYNFYYKILAGEENAKHFEENCWNIFSTTDNPMEPVPAVVVIMGPPKSGKTSRKHYAEDDGILTHSSINACHYDHL
jgi:hypothetical protein